MRRGPRRSTTSPSEAAAAGAIVRSSLAKQGRPPERPSDQASRNKSGRRSNHPPRTIKDKAIRPPERKTIPPHRSGIVFSTAGTFSLSVAFLTNVGIRDHTTTDLRNAPANRQANRPTDRPAPTRLQAQPTTQPTALQKPGYKPNRPARTNRTTRQAGRPAPHTKIPAPFGVGIFLQATRLQTGAIRPILRAQQQEP